MLCLSAPTANGSRSTQARGVPQTTYFVRSAAMISPIPLLIVHGDQDPYFPAYHGQRLFDAAREPKEFWIEPGFGHAESGISGPLVDRIAEWVREHALVPPEAVSRVGIEEVQ